MADQPAAADVVKGELPLLTLSERDVAELLDDRALLDALEGGFRDLSRGVVQVPDRPDVSVPGGLVLAMPAWRPGSPIGVKLVSLFAGNLARGLPSHLALIALLDPETGAPLCVMDGTYVTGARTAGATMVSVRLLAREDARVATIVGAGVQAREHLRLLPLVRDVERVFVASEYPHDAERLAGRDPRAEATGDLEAAVRASDVVCLCTSSSQPVLDPDWVRPGTHVTSIGYAPPGGELPRALAERARLFVETVSAFEAPPVGCAELAGVDPGRGAELGQVLLGEAPARTSEDEVTVYKAMGNAIEDLVAAELVYRTALERGQGAITML